MSVNPTNGDADERNETHAAAGSASSEQDLPPESVRTQLERVLESPNFERADRARAFLRFIVDEALKGRADRLKAFTIAREVFERDESFDPQTDTIVRVEAGALRRRLEHYYLTGGRDDPIVIDVPKGGYEPNFSWNVTHPQESGTSIRRTTVVVGITLLILLGIVGGLFLKTNQPPTPGRSVVLTSAPFVAVLPLSPLSNDPLEERLAAGLGEAIITKLSKLSGLSVMAHASIVELKSRSMNIASISSEFGATHVLRGSLEKGQNKVRANIQLIDTSTTTTVWADQLEGTVDKLLDLEDAIAGQVATELLIHINPDERTRLLHRYTLDPEALLLFRQALVLIMPPNDMTRVLTARRLFRRVIQLDPAFAGGYAGESFTHSISVIFLKATEPTKSLRKAIALATKAIETDPIFGMGYATLAFAYALSGKPEQSLTNARRAVAVQPGDAFGQWLLGVNLILAGKPDEAIAPLTRAQRLDPVEPRTPYQNVLGIAYYATGEYVTAVELFEQNLKRGGPAGPHMDVFRAAAYVELGREKKAQQLIDQTLRSHPGFPVEKWLEQFLASGDSFRTTTDNLHRLGLPPNE